MNENYQCKECGWQGIAEQLEYEKVESCMGNDLIEVCPKCGSMNVWHTVELPNQQILL
ncbi:MAG TPA: hypothetical protein VJY41_08990 [Prolixibacteraceae bacterium]|nr:hypothetical protein [Prolixibacteraceae bacterium]